MNKKFKHGGFVTNQKTKHIDFLLIPKETIMPILVFQDMNSEGLSALKKKWLKLNKFPSKNLD